MQTKVEGLRGWSWRNHKGETRLRGGGGPPAQEAFRLLSLHGPLPSCTPLHPFIQQRLSAHAVLGDSRDMEMDLSLRGQEETDPKWAVTM